MKIWEHAQAPKITKIGRRMLTYKTFVQPDGAEAEYVTFGGIDDRHGAVIALTPDNQVVIAEQFRPGPEIIMQELPGGGIKPEEDPQAAVMRELYEETGYVAEEVILIGTSRKDAYMNATWYFYLAHNCRYTGTRQLDTGEFVDVKLISIDQLIANAKQGKMSDAQAVLIAYDDLMRIQKETTI